MSPAEFCEKHRACPLGRDWAIATGCATMRDLWERDDLKPEWYVWIATRPGVMSDRDSRLFACRCVRQVWHLLTDDRSKRAVEVSEAFADGKATSLDLTESHRAAWFYAGTAAANAAYAASGDVSMTLCASYEAARAATQDAFCAANWVAASEAAFVSQVVYLRTMEVTL